MLPLAGNTKRGSITVLMTSCLTGLETAVWQLTIFVFICKTDKPKPVKQEVNCTVILPTLAFPASFITYDHHYVHNMFKVLSTDNMFIVDATDLIL